MKKLLSASLIPVLFIGVTLLLPFKAIALYTTIDEWSYGYYTKFNDLTSNSSSIEMLSETQNYNQNPLTISTDFQISVTNNNNIGLSNVGFVWQFGSSGNAIFDYNNSAQEWSWYNFWMSVTGSSDYFSLDRNNTDAALIHTFSNGLTGSISESDSVPIVWIGDIAAGQSVTFDFGMTMGSYNNFEIAGFLVAEATPVPEPATIFLFGLGMFVILVKKVGVFTY